jgi:hypothetical protein
MSSDTAKKDLKKRGAIRFSPDAGTYATIDTEATRPDGSFQPSIVALVPEESSKGAGIIVLKTESLQDGSMCRIQIGNLTPMLAEVRWRKELDKQTLRLGVLFVE